MVKKAIQSAIAEELGALGLASPFGVDYPRDPAHGSYATNAAMVAAKQAGKKPHDVAASLCERLRARGLPFIERIEVAGPGFINFHLTRAFFSQALEEMLKADAWGKGDSLSGKKVLCEFTDPNPFKEFHIGHLMSNTIGESISRLVEWQDGEVKRANYQGDVGPHVAKALYGLMRSGKEDFSVADIQRAYELGSKAYEEDAEAKREIDAINRSVYDGNDPAINQLYRKGREISIRSFKGIYDILGTTFDFSYFESETWRKGLAVVKAHPELFEESDGALVFRGEKYGLHTRVFVTSQGTPTYEAKDLGLIEEKRAAYPFDISISITANEQNAYFKVVYAAIEQLYPDLKGKLMHIGHGMMRLTSGKMSSRKGNIVTGTSLIEEMASLVREKVKQDKELPDEIVTEVAVGGIKYVILRQAAGKDIIFDPEKSISLEGDSGPYLQYAHVRACAIGRKAKEVGLAATTAGHAAKLYPLEMLLVRFPEVVERAAHEYEPHYLTTYLTELAAAFSSWYAVEHVVEETPEAPYRLAIAEAFRKTMERGLWLLGIKAPQEM